MVGLSYMVIFTTVLHDYSHESTPRRDISYIENSLEPAGVLRDMSWRHRL